MPSRAQPCARMALAATGACSAARSCGCTLCPVRPPARPAERTFCCIIGRVESSSPAATTVPTMRFFCRFSSRRSLRSCTMLSSRFFLASSRSMPAGRRARVRRRVGMWRAAQAGWCGSLALWRPPAPPQRGCLPRCRPRSRCAGPLASRHAGHERPTGLPRQPRSHRPGNHGTLSSRPACAAPAQRGRRAPITHPS